ncbi:hypothetical protein [Neobacillus ginsengisoli]|uniref:Uncharacterized protein n=1 Tax=Neobacillus ginsengisoli TaxID=904295 RepID=A0ABT9XXY5_9BACI|nr:hypothetical protein [Neobacillus ginsengisoli]MDQ0200440.1 hypothetical protein [Neobacillus ginsengisoli]
MTENKVTNEALSELTMQGGPLSATEEEQKTFEAAREGIKAGFGGTFDQLEDFLKKA